MDIREPKPDKILLLRNEKDKKVCMPLSMSHKNVEMHPQVPIYSIHSSPTNSHLFCTSGRSVFETFLVGSKISIYQHAAPLRDQFIRVFDRRYLGLEARGGGQVFSSILF